MPDPIKGLIQNVTEVQRLMQIHEQVSRATPGRKHDLEVLNKSGIVLLVACWEAFVEDLATVAFDGMLAHASDHNVFPADVLARASRGLKGSQDNREGWKLAGTGWKSVLADHRTDVLNEYIGKFNTPKPKQVDLLFLALVGMPSISQGWSWHRMTAAAASQKLNDLVELRGSIAHRVAAAKAVHKISVTDSVDFIYRVSALTSNRTGAFVYARTKQRLWPSSHFGKVR
jgi:HEPN superfamily RiboL-PSP-like protein